MASVCLTLLCLVVPPARGGHAEVRHDHGGHAATIQPIGRLRDWVCIHNHEGAWNSNTGNGYFGGLQMDRPFMLTYGRDKIRQYGDWAHTWSPRDQMVVAQRAWRTRGYRPWPNTARACGLL